MSTKAPQSSKASLSSKTSPSTKTPRSRFARRGTVIAALAAGLVLVAPAAAQAHVGVSPDTIEADGSAVLTFSFTHGCENSPTRELRITMPEGLASVSPTVDANWDIAVEHADNGLVSAVTYTALTPVSSELRGTATMAVRLSEGAATSLAFPVEQRCETGVNEWVEIATDGEDPHDLDSPAPVVTVTDAGSDSGETSDAGHGDHSAASEAAESAQTSPDPLATALGAGGLLAGIAALIVAVLAYRRSAHRS